MLFLAPVQRPVSCLHCGHPLENVLAAGLRQELDFRERMRITFEETDWLEDRKETDREKDSGMEY